jgi:hypothetical protein
MGMNREVKFRGRIACGLRNEGQWVYWGINGTDLIDAIDHDTIGQYTGLPDKNGKEAYEGDIIQFNFEDDSKEGIINTLIVFEHGMFCYRPDKSKQVERGNKWEQEHDFINSRWWQSGGYQQYPLCEGFYGYGSICTYDESKSNIEIIGNIYESPELLKEA